MEFMVTLMVIFPRQLPMAYPRVTKRPLMYRNLTICDISLGDVAAA
jgi:hypothetical protein